MKKELKTKYAIGILIMTTMASFVGALSSTIAWYAYSTRSTVSLTGTSVSQTEQLQIGLVTDIEFPDEMVENYGITYVTDNTVTPSVRYAFTAPGYGLNSTFINYYLQHSGHATNQLFPVTSNEYETGDSISLKDSPVYGHASIDEIADAEKYCNLQFCFRVVKIGAAGNQIYSKNQNIWLSDAQAHASNTDDVHKAVRCYIENEDLKFILNPSDTADGGETKVGGLLDLNNDGYFDSDSEDEMFSETEIIYGQYDDTTVPTLTTFTEDSEILDINGSGNSTELTTFTAKHKSGYKGYETLEGLAVKTAKYKTMSQIKPDRDEAGMLSGGQVLCTTSNDNFAIAKLSMKVYIEGWDYSIINQNAGHLFALGLTFEINKVS